MRLKQLRKERNLTQKGLAENLYTSQTTIYRYECGQTQPDLQMLINIAQFFGVSVDYLLENTQNGLPDAYLTEAERRHLRWYRSLDAQNRIKTDALIRLLLKRQK